MFLVFDFEKDPIFPVFTKWFNLKLYWLLEKIIIKNMRKYKPPIHCEDDLHNIKVGSKYLIFPNIENPVEVIPEKLSNKESIKVIW